MVLSYWLHTQVHDYFSLSHFSAWDFVNILNSLIFITIILHTHTDCKTMSFSDLICTIIHNQLNIILFPNCCSKTQFNFCFSFLPIEFLKMLQMSLPPPTISLTEILDLNSKFPVPENCNYS